MYPRWNHWLTAFEPLNGRYAQAVDRVSHSSLTHMHWNPHTEGNNRVTKTKLHGMPGRPADKLAAIAQSWESPPSAELSGERFSGVSMIRRNAPMFWMEKPEP